MFVDFKHAMGALSVAIATYAYATMLWGIFRHGKHPSPVSWLGFGFCTGVGFLVQVWSNAGIDGSLVMGWTAICCFVVAIVSWWTGGIEFNRLDQITFGLGIAAFVAWLVCYFGNFDQTLAVVFATTSDLFLYGPSIRNGWSKPEKENPSGYALNSVKFVPSLFALSSYSLATWLYPAALVVMNGAMNIYLLVRQEWLWEGAGRSTTKNTKLIDAGFPPVVAVLTASLYGVGTHTDLLPTNCIGWVFYVALLIVAAATLILEPKRGDNGHSFFLTMMVTLAGALIGGALEPHMARATMPLVVAYGVVLKEGGNPIMLLPAAGISFLTAVDYVVSVNHKESSLLKWLPQKTLLPLSILGGSYVDAHWGLFSAACTFFGLIWLQLVWTMRTWPCQQLCMKPESNGREQDLAVG